MLIIEVEVVPCLEERGQHISFCLQCKKEKENAGFGSVGSVKVGAQHNLYGTEEWKTLLNY